MNVCLQIILSHRIVNYRIYFPQKAKYQFRKVLTQRHIPALSVLYEYFFLENVCLSILLKYSHLNQKLNTQGSV